MAFPEKMFFFPSIEKSPMSLVTCPAFSYNESMYLIFLHTKKDRREIHCIMKKILLIATGGTIASKRSEDGLTPMISSEELLSYVPKAR